MKDLRVQPAGWYLPAILLLALILVTPDDATAQRRKRAEKRRADQSRSRVRSPQPRQASL